MSQPLSTESYKGVRDFYPADWERLQTIFTTLRNTLALWGYEEYNASPLERSELYESKTSEEIVNEQTYTFVDRGERKVTLRPEMTPTLARMVATKRREIPFPLRWFSIPNCFRYERPQRGRLREFYQLNVDLVGVADQTADEEIIRLASSLLRAFGASDETFSIRVNSRPLLEAAAAAVGLSGDKVQDYLRYLDRKSKMTEEAFREATGMAADQDPLARIESATDEAVAREKNAVLALVERLTSTGVSNVVFDPTVTRGFDYYTGVVFEVFDADEANQRSLFGGGRFDRLVALFGSEPVPAVGFGMGDVILQDFLDTHGLVPSTRAVRPTLYLGTPEASDRALAERAAEALRDQGVRVWVNLTEKSLGDQVKDALRREIPHFVAFGKEEAATGNVRLKTLASSEERVVSLADLPATLSA